MSDEKDEALEQPITPTSSEQSTTPAPELAPEFPPAAPRESAHGAGDTSQEQLQAMEKRVRRTRISSTWVAIIVAIVLVVLMLIFILQNLGTVTVTYFGATGQLPLGVALLFAAIGGAALVAIVGVARLGQLRLNARQRRRVSKRAEAKRTSSE